MDLDVKFNGLDEVNGLIGRTEKQVDELRITAQKLYMALANLGIEVSQPTIDPPAD